MELKCVAQFNTPVEASIAQGMLENNDIPSVLDNATIVSVIPVPSAIGGVRLMVREVDFDKAAELLREHGDMGK